MTSTKHIILNHNEINHKIKRIAYQIYESNVDETEVILAGIDTNGYILAKKLKSCLDKISQINSTLCRVIINKKNPLAQITTSLKQNNTVTNLSY
jgi:pyrimidine operon attenuation protein/uracil phosphoribosyltransferase